MKLRTLTELLPIFKISRPALLGHIYRGNLPYTALGPAGQYLFSRADIRHFRQHQATSPWRKWHESMTQK